MQQKCRYVFFEYGKKRLNCRSFMQNRYIILRKGPNRDKIEPYKIWKITMQAPCRKSGEIRRKGAENRGCTGYEPENIRALPQPGLEPLRGGE